MAKYWDRKTERMMNVLGEPVKRGMIVRLARGGAMSVSKMSEPFNMTLPSAMRHVNAMEDAGFITTHKHGRVRICVYNPSAFKELAGWLASHSAFWEGSFDRLEKVISKKKK